MWPPASRQRVCRFGLGVVGTRSLHAHATTPSALPPHRLPGQCSVPPRRLLARRPQGVPLSGGGASHVSVLVWVPGLRPGSALSQNSWPQGWQVGLGPALSLARQCVGSGAEGAPRRLPESRQHTAAAQGKRAVGSRPHVSARLLWPRGWAWPVGRVLMSGHPPLRPTAVPCLWSFPAQATLARGTCQDSPGPACRPTGQPAGQQGAGRPPASPCPARLAGPRTGWVSFEPLCRSKGSSLGPLRRGQDCGAQAGGGPCSNTSQVGMGQSQLPPQTFKRPWSHGEPRAPSACDPQGDPGQSRALLDLPSHAWRDESGWSPLRGPMAGLSEMALLSAWPGPLSSPA